MQEELHDNSPIHEILAKKMKVKIKSSAATKAKPKNYVRAYATILVNWWGGGGGFKMSVNLHMILKNLEDFFSISLITRQRNNMFANLTYFLARSDSVVIPLPIRDPTILGPTNFDSLTSLLD